MPKVLKSREGSGKITSGMVMDACQRAAKHFMAANRDEALFLMSGILLALDVEDFKIDVSGGVYDIASVRAEVLLNKGDHWVTLTVN